MVKIIINGEAHNSSLAPKRVLSDIDLLSEKNLVFAMEDYKLANTDFSEMKDEIEGFLDYVGMVRGIKSEIEANCKSISDKINSDPDSDEIELSESEIKYLSDLAEENGIEDYLDMLDAIRGIENCVKDHGGQKRIEQCLLLSERLRSFDKFSIEDEEAVKEIHELKGKYASGVISEKEVEKLNDLIQSPDVEETRLSTMSGKLFEKALSLPDDAIIYVYPVGNFHVSGLCEKLKQMQNERVVNLEIYGNCLWDNEDHKNSFIASGEYVSPSTEGNKIKELFLSGAEGISEYYNRFYEIFPELRPNEATRVNGCESVKENEIGIR